MQSFQIEITETLQRTLSVEATSEADALEIVHNLYKSEQIVLDAADYVETDIAPLENPISNHKKKQQ